MQKEKQQSSNRIDPASLKALLSGIAQIESGFHSAIYALAEAGLTDTEAYKSLIQKRDDVLALRDALKPSVFL